MFYLFVVFAILGLVIVGAGAMLFLSPSTEIIATDIREES